MIGLPNQFIEDLANDLLCLKELDVDMVGMGPYIEHTDTPLYTFRDLLPPKKERLRLSLLMIATLRILMKDINIAAATALDTLDPEGRIKAIQSGANVLMPNITPLKYRENYFLYENKPYLVEADELINKLKVKGLIIAQESSLQRWGDSKHYLSRRMSEKLS
jgi:biotin synthase